MEKFKEESVIVMSNSHGSCLYVNSNTSQNFNILVKQGNKTALLVGDLNLIIDMNLKSGNVIKHGKIVTKESFEAIDSDDLMFCIKMNNNKICRKNGKVIYSHSYFTYDTKDTDEIITED
jgi:hypothetical protein